MAGKENSELRGIKIRSLNYFMMFVACGLYLLVIYGTLQVSRKYDAMIEATESYVEYEKSGTWLREKSDYLTRQVRKYTITMDPQYVEAYFEAVGEARDREQIREKIKASEAEEETLRYLQTALEDSGKLMEREVYAMRLVAEAAGQELSGMPQEMRQVELEEADRELDEEGKLMKARELVFDIEYQDAKKLIINNIASFLSDVTQKMEQRQRDSAQSLRESIYRQRVGVSLLFIMNVITFFAITILIVKPLQIYIKCIKEEKLLEITGSYEFKYLALTYNNIYEINAANEAMLKHKAEHDPLTGLMNRGAYEQLKLVLAVNAVPMALLLIDVDKFKRVNDGYGHETGDLVLKKVAGLLKNNFRTSDYPVRIGGDEFAVVMTDIQPKQKDTIRDKVFDINRALQNPEDGLPMVSISVGVAFSLAGFQDELYKKADMALYKVKENGRCGCEFYEEE